MSLSPDFTLLQVVPELETGGAERTTIDVAAAVVRAGGRALVASRGGRMAEELAAVGGELIALPVHSKNPLTMAANAARLADVVRNERVRLVHARSRAPAFSALWAARHARVPIVATYHGVYNARSGLKRWWNAVMTRGDVVIANSAYTRAHVIAEHGVDPDKVIAIPRGVDLARFSPEAVSDERVRALRDAWGIEPEERRAVVLLAGRLTRWKGQLLLLEAARRLRAEGRADFLLVLAGDHQGRGDYRAEVERAIGEGGLTGMARVVGHCADMPAAYLAADLAAAPSLEPEAFGRTAVEPQAMARPVLAAAHGGAVETVADGETGWLVPPGNAAAWAAALAGALDAGSERRAEMGRAGRARVERLFSVEAMTAATLGVYAQVLASRSQDASFSGGVERSGTQTREPS